MKTPEQMADEYVDEFIFGGEYRHIVKRGFKHAFLAGYQAAKDQQFPGAKPDKVLIDEPELVADVSKVMPQWISVKKRLPEEGVGWTTVYGCFLSRWSVQPGFYDRESKEWVSRFIGGYMDDEGYAPFESVTHWQPLPAPPEEGK